ncbi:MAG: MGMT family protein [Proteobacteria bacterium]|nr:MGMT family protein [Pseudomonadota bacterium]
MPRMPTEHVLAMFAAIRKVARRIPKGRVITYGQLAELAGFPGAARVAGAAMKTSTPADRLPWHRVMGKVGGRGRIAIHDPVGAAIQRQLLEEEGVVVGTGGLIALERYGWLPTGESGRVASPRRRPRSASKTRASSSRR